MRSDTNTKRMCENNAMISNWKIIPFLEFFFLVGEPVNKQDNSGEIMERISNRIRVKLTKIQPISKRWTESRKKLKQAKYYPTELDKWEMK